MSRATQMRRDALRRYFVFRLKLIELFHLHLLWNSLADEQFVPANLMEHSGREFADTVRTALLSWYCTIVDRTEGGLNIFNVWLDLFPNHRREIRKVRKEVEADWEILRQFRDKCGFHADTARNYFKAKQNLLRNVKKAIKAVQDFSQLAIMLIRLEEVELPDFVDVVEGFLLEFELEPGNMSIKRDAMRKLLILPRTNYKRFF